MDQSTDIWQMKLCKLNPSWLQEFGPKCSDFHSSLFPNNFCTNFGVLFWLRIKIAVFKNLFILKGRKRLLLSAKCYSWLFFFHKLVFKNIMYMSSKYYLYIYFHMSESLTFTILYCRFSKVVWHFWDWQKTGTSCRYVKDV